MTPRQKEALKKEMTAEEKLTYGKMSTQEQDEWILGRVKLQITISHEQDYEAQQQRLQS